MKISNGIQKFKKWCNRCGRVWRADLTCTFEPQMLFHEPKASNIDFFQWGSRSNFFSQNDRESKVRHVGTKKISKKIIDFSHRGPKVDHKNGPTNWPKNPCTVRNRFFWNFDTMWGSPSINVIDKNFQPKIDTFHIIGKIVVKMGLFRHLRTIGPNLILFVGTHLSDFLT